MPDVSYPWAFVAGLLSFLSPCVLPLVPPYLSYLAGATLDQLSDDADSATHRRALTAAVFFVLGYTSVFVALGASASLIGALVRQYMDVLAMIAGVLIIIMGLHFLGLFKIGFLYREARVQVNKPAGFFGAYVMGLAFAFGWTPCIGPILGAILSFASSGDTVLYGASLLAVYSAGLGIPFLIAAFAMGPFVRFLKKFRAHLGTVEKVMGVLLILTGIGFLTGSMATVSFWLLETFPALGKLG
ncbi:MAG: cytochrome c biogenesis CcdA family protein [Beijerinckiaceae bacterium]